MIGIVVGFDAGIELRSVDSVVCDWYSDDRANVYFDCLSAYAVANVGNDDKDFDSLWIKCIFIRRDLSQDKLFEISIWNPPFLVLLSRIFVINLSQVSVFDMLSLGDTNTSRREI